MEESVVSEIANPPSAFPIRPWATRLFRRKDAAAPAKSRQSCPTLCDPVDSSPPGSRPWDSPGKNTGVGCLFLLQCMEVKSGSEVAQSCPTLRDPMDCSLPGSRPWDFPGKSTGVGCHCLLREKGWGNSQFNPALWWFGETERKAEGLQGREER